MIGKYLGRIEYLPKIWKILSFQIFENSCQFGHFAMVLPTWDRKSVRYMLPPRYLVIGSKSSASGPGACWEWVNVKPFAIMLPKELDHNFTKIWESVEEVEEELLKVLALEDHS